jgi:hypothetical protein
VCCQIDIDGDILRMSDGAQTPLQFGDSDGPITLAEFIRFVQDQQ